MKILQILKVIVTIAQILQAAVDIITDNHREEVKQS